MNVLGILGSPRRGGNSEILLDEALKGAGAQGAKTEKICLGEISFRPCIECAGCDKTGICVLEDELTPVYGKIERADALVIASPIFFGSLTAQTKAMIDRFQSWWVVKYKLKHKHLNISTRRGYFICVGGFKKDKFFNNAKAIIKVFFTVCDTEYDGELFVGGVDEKGAVTQKDRQRARQLL